MRLLKQSTAVNILVVIIDSADHVTGKTGLTLTITASKAGGAFASITPTVTERTVGGYQLALTSGHTDTLGDLVLHITGTGADPQDIFCQIIAVDLADAVAAGLSRLDAAISSRSTYAGGAVASVTAAVTVGTNNDKTGYSLTAGEEVAIADALLDRNMATGTDSGSESVRTVRQALRVLRNKVELDIGKVKKEDDTTDSWTFAKTTDPAAVPITKVDPT